jgi:hypothetical protein
MARGKHAAQAARQRYEATLEVVDRLNERTAELKIRTRQVEALAKEAEPLRRRVAELEMQLAAVESPKLEQLRTLHDQRVLELEDLLSFCVRLHDSMFVTLCKAFGDAAYDCIPAYTYDDNRFKKLTGQYGLFQSDFFPRDVRRMLAQHKFWAMDRNQDNLRSEASNFSGHPNATVRAAIFDRPNGCNSCKALGSICSTCSAWTDLRPVQVGDA